MTRVWFAGLLSIALLGITSPTQADLVEGFESPDIPTGGFVPLPPGPYATEGSNVWTVVGTSVVHHDGGTGSILGPAHSGAQYLDLFGPSATLPSAITTTFPTIAGLAYDVTFAYANNPFHFPPSPPASMDVTVGSFSTTVSHSTSVPGALDWTVFSAPAAFVAAGASTTITFATPAGSTIPGGILLDSIAVTAVPEARSWLAGGLICGVVGMCYALRGLGQRKPQVAV